MSTRTPGWLVVAMGLTLIVGACGDDGGEQAERPGAVGAVDLRDVCPDPVVVQAPWYPQAEQAAAWQLVGTRGEYDSQTRSYRGPLGDTGVDIEIRVGGPAVGDQSVTSLMYQDDDILLGMVTTDEVLGLPAEQRTVAVVTTLEIGPQGFMFDPDTYDFTTISDIGESDATVGYFEGSLYMAYFLGTGQLKESQLDSGYDGSPARWLTEGGRYIQQGFIGNEPYVYEHELPEWGKPVGFLLFHDAGLEAYEAPLAVRADALDEAAPCLEELVPLIQQAQLDYLRDPTDTNRALVEVSEEFTGEWEYSPGTAEHAYTTIVEGGLMGNGSDQIIGNFDLDRVEGVIEAYRPGLEQQGTPIEEGLQAEDLYTNQFIDESIGAE